MGKFFSIIWKIVKYSFYLLLILAALMWILESFGFVESYDDRQASEQREKLIEQIEDDTTENTFLKCKRDFPQWQSYYLLDKPIERTTLIRLIKRLDDTDYTFSQIYEIYNQRVIQEFYDDDGTFREENLYFFPFPEEVPKGLFFPKRDGVFKELRAGIQESFIHGSYPIEEPGSFEPIDDYDSIRDGGSSLTIGGLTLNREKLTTSRGDICEVFQTDNFDLYAESLDKEAKQTSIDFLSSKYLELKKESDDRYKKQAEEQEEKNKI